MATFRIYFGQHVQEAAAPTTSVPYVRRSDIHDEPWVQYDAKFLSKGFFAPAAGPSTSVPKWLTGGVEHPREDHFLSRVLNRSRGEDLFLQRIRYSDYSRHETPEQKFTQQLLRKGVGEDRFLHRTQVITFSRQEVPDPYFTQQFLRKGVGEDPFLHRLRVAGLQQHDRGEETAIPIFLKRGYGEDPLVPVLLGRSNYIDQIPYDTGGGQFLSRGSFLFVAPDIPVIHNLLLRGIAHDAYIFEDYAVFFPSKFIKVGSDFVPPPVVASPVVWQYLARTKGRWGR